MSDPKEARQPSYRGRILVVDDEQSLRDWLGIYLKRKGHDHVAAASGQEALELATEQEFDLVITDLKMPRVSGLEVLRAIRHRWPTTEVVIMTAFATAETAIEAMKAGAYDYLTKPFKIDEIDLVINRALEKRALVRDNSALREQLVSRYRFERLVGKSSKMAQVFDLARRAAATRATVLITGESGTGKELVARALHTSSDRAQDPFVAINCGAIPETLLEAELFGHLRGAFTGAVSDSGGVFLAANGGTLVLDEIGELPLALQVKLLRVLQERTVRPVGGTKDRPVDVRLVAITNRDLPREVAEGRFRQDLYYRINVIQIHLPSLRERPEDIPLLVHHFVQRISAEHGRRFDGVEPDAMQSLLCYSFPGNVRELENLVERAVTLAPGPRLTREHLSPPPAAVGSPASLDTQVVIPSEGVSLDEIVAEMERRYLLRALELTGGVRTEAARLLGVSFRSLRYRLNKLGIGSD
jgi:two-component system response regulator PilR (NtrC family)